MKQNLISYREKKQAGTGLCSGWKAAVVGLCLLMGAVGIRAQSLFTGRVTDEAGHPFAVNVSLRLPGSALVKAFTSTDGAGNYLLQYAGAEDSVVIVVSGLQVGKNERVVRNVSQRLDFVLEEKSILLKTVSVKAQKIRQDNDTLNYLVSSFADQSDRVIGDVLKKMPGIEVDENGGISYNGKAISHFYVEGMDLLQGRYGLATQNLPNKAVSVVQVLKNHQPVKVLKDKVFTDAVSINLKLQDDAKGVFTASALAGAGYQPALWTAELVGMMFGKKYQTMTVYKGNNTGDDVQQEFRSKYGSGQMTASNTLLRVQTPSAPEVSTKRYFQNHSHAVSTNHLLKLKNGGEWSTGVMYYNDRIDREGRSLTEQYLPGGDRIVVDENLRSTNHIHNLEVASNMMINNDQKYLNNKLAVRANWNEDEGTGTVVSNVNAGNRTVNQRLERPSLSLSDRLNLTRAVGANTYTLNAGIGYSEVPHTLSIAPVDYWDDLPVNSLEQDFTLRHLAFNLGLSWGLKAGKFSMYYLLYGSGSLQNMDTELGSREPGGDAYFADPIWRNDLWYNTWQGGLNQFYSYKSGDFRIELSLPVSYQRLCVDDRLAADKKTYNKPLVSPSMSMYYTLGNWDFKLYGRYTYDFGDLYSTYRGYVMEGYRNLLRNSVDDLPETREARAGGSISYNDAFSALFGSVSGEYMHGWRNLLYGFDYDGILRIRQILRQPTTLDSYTARFSLSKGLDFWNSTLQLKGWYLHSNSQGLIQGEVVDFLSDNVILGFKANLVPARWMSLDYSCDWQWSQSHTATDNSSFSAVKSVVQEMHLKFFPTKSLTLDMGVEHQYTNLASTRHMVFGDFKVVWRNRFVDVELEANNLFNQKRYMRVFYSGADMYRYSCDLRPVSALVKIRYNFK